MVASVAASQEQIRESDRPNTFGCNDRNYKAFWKCRFLFA